MKLSIVLSTQPASFTALAYQGKIAENLAKISRMGFDGVELAVRDPRLLDVPQLEELLSQNHLQVPAIGTGQVYGEEGLSFTDIDPAVRERATQRVMTHLELAGKLGAVVIIGLIRGQKVAEIGKEHAEAWFGDALDQCASKYPDVRLVIEPINRYETGLINTVKEGLDFLDRLNRENVGLLLDTFHMNIEEPSITESIRLAGPRLFHFHVADSNRCYPGAGHLNFPEIIEALGRINYDRYISGEMQPFPDSDTAAAKMMEFLSGLINT